MKVEIMHICNVLAGCTSPHDKIKTSNCVYIELKQTVFQYKKQTNVAFSHALNEHED